MRKFLLLFLTGITFTRAGAQFSVRYDPAVQDSKNIQYFKPKGNLFVGDCIPFFHDGTYFLYWLLDSAHHAALNGLGGHQWTLSTSRDLVNWQHHPVVLGIDEEWEKSICTGSVVFSKGHFYAFYATRLIGADGQKIEQLSYAISEDGIHFRKQQPNPFYTYAKGYSKRDFRDPKVVVDSAGKFHLFVSSATDSAMNDFNGAMVHMESTDLKHWSVKQPLIWNLKDVPECPDYFKWGNWYYLIYGQGGNTFYLQSTSPYGPWQYPSSQALNEEWSNVVKTAAFSNGRRIAAGWIPSRQDHLDEGQEIFGGNIVLRELSQEKDGSLSARFPKEVIPPASAAIPLKMLVDSLTHINGNEYSINSPNGMGSFFMEGLPLDCRISFEVEMTGKGIEEYGLFLRGVDRHQMGYKLAFSPVNKTAILHESAISGLDFLGKKMTVDIIMKGDIIDVSIGNRRCIVNRLGEIKGSQLWFYGKHGKVSFRSIRISPLEVHAEN
ncbi:family 43 glycosylhydrolase [Flavihumibacter profundi]|jgi:beta-fructofuranosidase|uniref:family 43 glycosylhydrolase n=1 Tax=Flavihumibacter profundi TaxID=2716883 RepID=UPI001CC5A147|nr:family 43 glycosylhydrolase [Flavihumibacter profundi]MBZ5857673.1 family 43 glycosylhydrolase [Flavihumibacter profundi]